MSRAQELRTSMYLSWPVRAGTSSPRLAAAAALTPGSASSPSCCTTDSSRELAMSGSTTCARWPTASATRTRLSTKPWLTCTQSRGLGSASQELPDAPVMSLGWTEVGEGPECTRSAHLEAVDTETIVSSLGVSPPGNSGFSSLQCPGFHNQVAPQAKSPLFDMCSHGLQGTHSLSGPFYSMH